MATVVVTIYSPDTSTRLKLPLFSTSVPAGFPSPADDYIEKELDLNEYLIKHPSATFFVRVDGDSMIGVGIHSGDLLIVDRAIEPKDGAIIIAVLHGEMVVKRFRHVQGKIFLVAENGNYNPLEITAEMGFEIWGVVLHVIHRV